MTDRLVDLASAAVKRVQAAAQSVQQTEAAAQAVSPTADMTLLACLVLPLGAGACSC
jgi:hypothetical protein